MWNEQTTKTFWTANRSKFAGDVKAKVLLDMVGRFVKPPVLDVGCGSGALLDLLPGSVGVDVAPKHPRAITASAAMLPFPAEIFQTVFATDVLEHLTPAIMINALIEVSRVLRPGGRFILTTPVNEDLALSTVHCPGCGTEFHRWGHQQSFTLPRICELLGNSGIDVRVSRILPLSQIGDHHSLRYYWRLAALFGMVRPGDMLIVGEKRWK